MKSYRPIACLALAFMAVSAHAQYKCQADGKTVFQQMPCAGDGGQKLDVKPASGAAPAASEAPRTDWSAVIRGRPAPTGSAPTGSAPAGSTTAADRAPCPTPQKIRELEFEASKISNRNNSSVQAELADARRCR